MRNSYERVATTVRMTSARMYLTVVTGIGLVISKYLPGARDNIPEPFDIVDHAGNIGPSLIMGANVGLAVGRKIADRAYDSNSGSLSTGSLRVRMAMAGLLVGVLTNYLAEYGIEMAGGAVAEAFRDDPLDLVYGTAAATIGAAAVPKIEQTAVQGGYYLD